MRIRPSLVTMARTCFRALRSQVLPWVGTLTLLACSSTSTTPEDSVSPNQLTAAQDRASISPASPSPTSPPKAKAPTRAVSVKFDAESNTIAIGTGEPMTLAAIQSQLDPSEADLLREVTPGEWLLSANLAVPKGASLRIAGPEVTWLKLNSTRAGFVWLKALGGNLDIQSTKITSWDTAANAVDMNSEVGRSFVLARNGSRMNIIDSEMSYLGYFANESYGVSWRMPGTTGQAINSKFGYNFYGLYAHEASDLVIRNNEVHHSVRYGIDPHTRSNQLVIEGNRSHHNGKQGIILAEGCSDSIIRNNIVFSNTLHGIVIYQGSNNNVVEGNTAYGNGLQGININDSADNLIRNNTVYSNTQSGIGIGENAQNNQIEGNTTHGNGEHGIYLYSESRKNTLTGNIVRDNLLNGIYVKSDGNVIAAGNEVSGNKVGVLLKGTLPQTISRTANQISNNLQDDVLVDDGSSDSSSDSTPESAP